MRLITGVTLSLLVGCGEKEQSDLLRSPELYPPVRAATPDALVGAMDVEKLGSPLLESDGGLTDAATDASVAPVVDAGSSDADVAFEPLAPFAPLSSEDASGDGSAPQLTTDSTQALDASAPASDAASESSDPTSELPAAATTDVAPSANDAIPAPPPPGGTSSPPPPGGTGSPPPPGGTQEPSSNSAPEPPGGTNAPIQPGAINLATAVQQRFYSGGPTDLLRIVKNVDQRLAELQLDPAKHPCLSAAPVAWAFSLPSEQTFDVQLQCIQTSGAGSSKSWLALGFDSANSGDFYFVEGQASGMGGAYRVDGKTGDIDGWIAIADKAAPNNSQVLIHLFLDKASGSLELAFAGSGVGFCSAHLKTTADALFVVGNMVGPAPEGVSVAAGSEYCQASRSGCFKPTSLTTELDADAAVCDAVNANTFALATDLDGSSNGNVTPSQIHEYFNTPPQGIASF